MSINGEKISEQCKRCGIGIAAIKADDALCCRCRYGSHSSSDAGHGHVIDCVEWMHSRVGYRFMCVGAFDLWAQESQT
jgi:hypothetical protein